jgi:hypothetical protein
VRGGRRLSSNSAIAVVFVAALAAWMRRLYGLSTGVILYTPNTDE